MLTAFRNRLRGRRRPDEGFTLIELIIAVAILGVVMSAICAAMLAALRTNTETKGRLEKSGDVQFSSTWFADDIASTNTVATGVPTVCGGAATALLKLDSTDIDTTVSGVPASPPPTPPAPTPEPTRSISYVLVTVSDGEGTSRQLERRACSGSGPAEVTRIARRLSTTTAPIVTRTPDTSAPALVTLSLTADDGSVFTLTGNRRSS